MDEPVSISTRAVGGRWPRQLKLLALVTLALTACFSVPLYHLVRFCFHSQLYSYILLVPIISFYLAWTKRGKLAGVCQTSWLLGVALALAAGVVLVLFWTQVANRISAEQDRLCLLTLAFLLFFGSGCAFLLGADQLRTLAFPVTFLIFMVPLPASFEAGMETFLQHSSAESAYLLLKLFGMPILRQGTHFQMPGMAIEVAPECSGIHSSVVLFITALLAAQLLLRKPWARTVLALSVIPLGILRNAVRIFTLAELCVHVDPKIIDSPLHHKGGPLFFVVSLVPFFLMIWLLRKLERRKKSHPSNS